MRHSHLSALLALMCLAPWSSQARSLEAADALKALDKAAREVRGEDRTCERAIRKDLKRLRRDVEGLIEDLRLRDARHALEDVQSVIEGAHRNCSRRVKRPLKAARVHLQEVLKDAQDADAIRGGGRADPPPPPPPPPAPTPTPPPPVPDVNATVVDCWDHGDPGCHFQKHGRSPMGKVAWQGFHASVKAAGPNVFQMLNTVKSVAPNQTFTSKQLIKLVALFKPSVFQMLDVVKICAPRVVDPQNGLGIGVPFQPNTFQANDAVKVMAQQAPGQKLERVQLK